jgi:hypothetical protein
MFTGAACGGGDTGSGGGGTNGTGGSGGSASTATTNPTSMSTVNPTTTTGTSMADCGALPGNLTPAACGTCVETSCCKEAKACDTGSDCLTLLTCILNATDASGLPACEMQTPGGKSDLEAFQACLNGSKCVDAAACNGPLCTTNTIGVDGSTTRGAACNACNGTNCCAELSTLTDDVNADSDCTGGGDCVPIDDLNACTGNPDGCTGGAHAKAAAQCQDHNCPSSCGIAVCDSGIVFSSAKDSDDIYDCISCLATKCCTQFDASMCNVTPTPPASCQQFLDDLDTCANDPTCNMNPDAVAANDCEVNTCKTECGGN